MTDKKQVYKGTVRTSRGASTQWMSTPRVLESFRQTMGLAIIPGTLNITLTEVFDLSLLDYTTLANMDIPQIDPAEFAAIGLDCPSEQGLHWTRIVIADRYPGGLFSFTWAVWPGIGVELVSTHHLRTVLNLKDGDIIEFTLDCVSSGGTGTK